MDFWSILDSILGPKFVQDLPTWSSDRLKIFNLGHLGAALAPRWPEDTSKTPSGMNLGANVVHFGWIWGRFWKPSWSQNRSPINRGIIAWMLASPITQSTNPMNHITRSLKNLEFSYNSRYATYGTGCTTTLQFYGLSELKRYHGMLHRKENTMNQN